MRNSILFLTLLLLFLSACQKDSEPITSIGDEDISFRSNDDFEGDFITVDWGTPVGLCGTTPEGNPMFLIQGWMAEGTTNVTGTSSFTILNFCVAPIQPDDPSTSPGRFEGDLVITGENGNQISMDFRFKSFVDPQDEEIAIFKGQYFITGGTGPFAGASGLGRILGQATNSPVPDFSNPPTFQFEGKIKY